MLRRFVTVLAASAAGCLAGAATAGPPAAPPAPPAPVVGVVDGRQLVKDCLPWSPRGLSFFGRIAPAGKPLPPDVAAARAAFSHWTVEAVKAFGGDTMRLQAGLPFLDPQSPQYE